MRRRQQRCPMGKAAPTCIHSSHPPTLLTLYRSTYSWRATRTCPASHQTAPAPAAAAAAGSAGAPLLASASEVRGWAGLGGGIYVHMNRGVYGLGRPVTPAFAAAFTLLCTTPPCSRAGCGGAGSGWVLGRQAAPPAARPADGRPRQVQQVRLCQQLGGRGGWRTGCGLVLQAQPMNAKVWK